ncbi:MAG TPA: DUF4242 domain-containing protein [Tessaracoccus flavescens]|uniref:DUF4242 domain-containing protein n=1 Tax=Tessaracoccus flavescens TaxID=399497 RepID=A0A921ES83_9ACTN|nr:DUF4242 domain-containing protein [Tessaracoccus flavescens]
MSLYLVELTSAADAQSVLADLAATTATEFIEAQVTADASRIFAILEADSADDVAAAVAPLEAEASDPAEVRLVGADLSDIKAARPEAGYLVEWDIPSHIDMDTYLARKAEKTPLYDQVPEVSFLRTYVREDMAKCLCFYDAPDADAVVHARDVVSTPVDRLHALGRIELP